jgi:hypothetical protein
MKSSSIALTTIFSILALLSSSFSIINKQIEQNLTSKVKRLVNFKIKDEINSINYYFLPKNSTQLHIFAE